MNIGIIYLHPKEYLGGYNYIFNLINLLSKKKNFKIYVYCDYYFENKFIKEIKKENIIIKKSFIADKKSLLFWAHKLFEKIFKSFFLIDLILKKDGINIVTHSYYYGKLDYIHWVPDFQFMYFPNLFKNRFDELRVKTKLICSSSKKIILSSFDSMKDLQKLFDDKDKDIIIKTFVHQFPVEIKINYQKQNKFRNILAKEIGINKKYFLIANQFWDHKNYVLAFKAFHILNKFFPNIFLICCGSNKDSRNNNKINLKKKSYIKLLEGMPYDFIHFLHQNSLAYINPSLFEGWNTGVEEAKIYNKFLVLSDIDVHKEQVGKYKKKLFFKKNSVLGLVKCLFKIAREEQDRPNLKLNYLNKQNINLKGQRLINFYNDLKL